MTTKIICFTKEDAIVAVTQNGFELKHCSLELKNDEDVVMAAIKQNDCSFHLALNELKNNKTFILKALNKGVAKGLIVYATKKIKSDIEILSILLEKSTDGMEFRFAKGEVAFNKELAANSLLKWGNRWGTSDLDLWKKIHPTLKEFFPKDSFYEKAQSYLNQLEQERQAELVAGGSKEEDAVVW